MHDNQKGIVIGNASGDKVEQLLKDIAYNLRRLVLLQGGGEWKGTKTLVIPAKSYVTVEFVEEFSSRLINVSNIEQDKTLWLFQDISYASDPLLLEKNSFPIAPGLMATLLLEYKEGVYMYNPYDEPANIKVDIYAMRTCFFQL